MRFPSIENQEISRTIKEKKNESRKTFVKSVKYVLL